MSNLNFQEILCMPPELSVLAENVSQNLLPSKSKKYYEAAYKKMPPRFYFNEMAKQFKLRVSSLFPNV